MFRNASNAPSYELPKMTETEVATLKGPWTVSFQPNRGAPASVTFDKLISWNDGPDSGVKYFSGIGTYTETLQAPANWFSGHGHVWIDLGDVKNLADVSVNGGDLGIVWHAPYRVDATDR